MPRHSRGQNVGTLFLTLKDLMALAIASVMVFLASSRVLKGMLPAEISSLELKSPSHRNLLAFSSNDSTSLLFFGFLYSAPHHHHQFPIMIRLHIAKTLHCPSQRTTAHCSGFQKTLHFQEPGENRPGYCIFLLLIRRS